MLCGQNFPLHLRCRLLDQAELTLNMLFTRRSNPNLLVHTQLHGIHDFNATRLAPPGTKCIAHEKSSQCGTWAPHGQHGWYIEAAPEHYQCYQIYIPKTQSTRICDTVEFFPTHCKMTNVSAHDAAIYTANDQLAALRKLATIFQSSITNKPISASGDARHCTPPHPPTPTPTPQQRPCTRSQTKKLVNTAPTATQGNMLFHTKSQPTNEPKPEEDMVPPPDIQHNNKTRIVPFLAKLRPQYPTKHGGLLEDLFPLVQAEFPNTGQQLE